MCPFWPFHYVLIFIILFLSVHRLVISSTAEYGKVLFNITFSPYGINSLPMWETQTVNFSIPASFISRYKGTKIELMSQDNDTAICSPSFLIIPFLLNSTELYTGTFNVTGNFMGSTTIRVRYKELENSTDRINEIYSLPVTVVRKHRLIDKVFTISVAVLVSILFVNFGCALNLEILTAHLRKPVSLVIGIIPQFFFMPIISCVLGRLIFSESLAMQLGIFFTGISPSGGASNIWVYVLNGNINLSIAITAIGNLCSFFTMPLWTFTVGRSMFSHGSMIIPYEKVATFAFSLMPPLLLGLLLQKTCPKISQLMVTILKPLSSFLIVFIIVFATVTNFYLFKLFTAKILFVGFCLPFLGCISALLFSYCCNQSTQDRLAIAVETSVQNTGIAIFMLRFSLPQPEADITTVVPVAVALMTPDRKSVV